MTMYIYTIKLPEESWHNKVLLDIWESHGERTKLIVTKNDTIIIKSTVQQDFSPLKHLAVVDEVIEE